MTAFIIIVSVLVFLILTFIFLIFPSGRKHPDLELIKGSFIAHRGLHDISPETPENSAAAFRAAVEAGYPIENDIHLTADGEVVVFHDDTLRRMCGIDGELEKMTLAELKKLRLAGTDEQIPTLEECLCEVGGKVPLLIEFKCRGIDCAALCEAADAVLSKYNGKYLVQSFYPTVLRWYKKNRPEVCRGQLASAFRSQKLYKKLLGCLLFNFMARPDFISYEHKYVSHPCFRICRTLGAFPVGWTFRYQSDVYRRRNDFNTYIFEGFIPK
ncbi:MAG: glycerophosphodiester phosphodiesterase family protein [Eubacteriales bacterium]